MYSLNRFHDSLTALKVTAGIDIHSLVTILPLIKFINTVISIFKH